VLPQRLRRLPAAGRDMQSLRVRTAQTSLDVLPADLPVRVEVLVARGTGLTLLAHRT
jgi:hypothetical protein